LARPVGIRFFELCAQLFVQLPERLSALLERLGLDVG
jgi:hypothetical protein